MRIWINKLRTWLSAVRVTAIFGVTYFVSQLSIGLILKDVGANAVLRLQTTFSAEVFVQLVGQWREAGTLTDYFNHFYLDFAHPIWYSIFLASLVARVLNTNGFGSNYNFLIMIPFLAGASDMVENAFHLYFLSDMSRVTPSFVFTSALFCNLKWLLCGLTLGFVLILGIRSRFTR